MTQDHPNVRTKLNTWRDAQRQAKAILSRLHADPALILAAAANPLLALQEAGYEINEDFKQEFEDRLRFGSDFEQIDRLRKKIFELAGKSFDLNSAGSLHAALSSVLERKASRTLTVSDTKQLYNFQAPNQKIDDPLERLRDLHPIMKLLLQYRRLNASVPPLATSEVYNEIRRGQPALPIKSINVRTGKAHK